MEEKGMKRVFVFVENNPRFSYKINTYNHNNDVMYLIEI
jgi:hypothetical protein